MRSTDTTPILAEDAPAVKWPTTQEQIAWTEKLIAEVRAELDAPIRDARYLRRRIRLLSRHLKLLRAREARDQ